MGKIRSKIGEIFGNTANELITSVGETVDRFVHTGEEKQEAQLAMQRLALEFKQAEMDMEQAYLQDRASAREMYKHDSSLQKVYAVVFLGFYAVLSIGMLWWLFSLVSGGIGADLPNWAAALISSIFTAASTKVGTITDFLFGGSQTDSDNRDVARQFEQAAAANNN